MEIFLVLHHAGFTYLSLFGLLERHVADFNTRNKILIAKLLKQGYRYYKLRKCFQNSIDDTWPGIKFFNVGLESLL